MNRIPWSVPLFFGNRKKVDSDELTKIWKTNEQLIGPILALQSYQLTPSERIEKPLRWIDIGNMRGDYMEKSQKYK